MAGIDFSMLERIAYRDADTPEKQKERDSLLQAGYLFVDSPENPFTAPQPSAPPESPPPQRKASGSQREAFTDHSGGRDYNNLYRVAHDYHRKHSPPVVEREYWKTHTPGLDDTPETELVYWAEAAKDMRETASAGSNDPFLMGLLTAVYGEIEREYKRIRNGAQESL